jgi:endonuclease/exonuclease/phosphatase family metal-dependent hydrolase
MSASIKLVQLNIERSKHLDLVIPFLKSQDADVITLQELMERDVKKFEEELEMRCFYAPLCLHPAEGNPGSMGNGVFSKYPILKAESLYYHQQPKPLVVHTPGVPGTSANAVTVCDIEKEGEVFRISTTHFTVALDGGVNELQRDHIQKMLEILSDNDEFVFSGDFNAPRGGEIFSAIAAKYKDNVPPEIDSSIDGSIHRAGPLPGIMVDGIFSTPAYSVSNVVMHSGLSDHCAFTAEISKTA